MTEGFRVEQVPWDWPRMAEVNELRYRALHEPFGVTRDDEWGDREPGAVHLVALAEDRLSARIVWSADRLVGYVRMDAAGGHRRHQAAIGGRGRAARTGIGTALMRELIRLAEKPAGWIV